MRLGFLVSRLMFVIFLTTTASSVGFLGQRDVVYAISSYGDGGGAFYLENFSDNRELVLFIEQFLVQGMGEESLDLILNDQTLSQEQKASLLYEALAIISPKDSTDEFVMACALTITAMVVVAGAGAYIAAKCLK